MRLRGMLLVVIAAALGLLSSSALAQPQQAVVYPAGWNLVGGPVGMDLSSARSPLYTLQGGDSTYETVPAGPVGEQGARGIPQAGLGYWAYFIKPTTVAVPPAGPRPLSGPEYGSFSFSVAVPTNEWVMIGDPYSVTVTVRDAAGLSVYDPGVGYWSMGTTLEPGQGAFVYSFSGSVTLCPVGDVCR